MEDYLIIVDKKTGKVIGSRADIDNLPDNEMAVGESLTEIMDNPHYNFKTKKFYNVVEKMVIVELTADEIESKITELKAQMGKELEVTDWHYIRRLETLEEVPTEVQDERAAIRLKFETEINNLMK